LKEWVVRGLNFVRPEAPVATIRLVMNFDDDQIPSSVGNG
jgi:hypothetical protein